MHSRELTTRVTESEIHFAVQAKWHRFLVLEDWCLSAGKKRLFLVHRKIFHLVTSSTPRCIFKRFARRLLSTPALSGTLNRFSAEIYLFFPPKSPTEILKLTPHRRHASEVEGFATLFGVRKEFFRFLPRWFDSTRNRYP